MAKATKKSKENDSDVMEAEPIISPTETSTAIATVKPADLKHLKELDVKIAKFKKDYAGLTIKDENDKDGYDQIHKALGEMRPTRTGLDKERKSVTEPYRMAVSYINKQYDEKISAIAEIEAPLKEAKDKIDDLKEQQKEQQRLEEEQKINNRINELTSAGCAFDSSYYSIGEISIGVVDIRVMSDELYKNFLQQVLDKSAAIKAEKERLQKIEDDRIAEQKRIEDEQREQLRLQQEELKKQQDAMRLEQEKFQEEKRKMEEEKAERQRVIDEENEKQRLAKIEKIVSARKEELSAIGFQFNAYTKKYVVENISLPESDVLDTENNFYQIIEDIKPKVQEAIIERQAVDMKLKLSEEKRIADKAIADQKERDMLEAIRKEEELAQLGDKKRYDHLVSLLKEISIPDLQTKTYKPKVEKIKAFIESLY